jgi:hypothetical protein
MALEFTKSLLKMITRALSGGRGCKARLARKADKLTDICEPIL